MFPEPQSRVLPTKPNPDLAIRNIRNTPPDGLMPSEEISKRAQEFSLLNKHRRTEEM